MNKPAFDTLLKDHGLRDTQPRRMVLNALTKMKKPASPYDIQKWISKKGDAVNTVTVYRVLEALHDVSLVHRHPCNGNFSMCTIPGVKGHHAFLHCTSCDNTEECCDENLCKAENILAKGANFKPTSHVSEIVGLCHFCTSPAFTPQMHHWGSVK